MCSMPLLLNRGGKPRETNAYRAVKLRRFLRARRWVIPDAYKQFHETEEWRKANNLDVLYDTIDLEVYDQSRRLVRKPINTIAR